MQFKVSCYQHKTVYYIYEIFDGSLMITTKPKLVIDTQASIQKGRHHEKKKRRDREESQNTINKMASVSPFLFIVILNVNGLNCLIIRYNVAKWT